MACPCGKAHNVGSETENIESEISHTSPAVKGDAGLIVGAAYGHLNAKSFWIAGPEYAFGSFAGSYLKYIKSGSLIA